MTKTLLVLSRRSLGVAALAFLAQAFTGCNHSTSIPDSTTSNLLGSFVTGTVMDGGTYTPLAGARVQFGDTSNVMYTGADGKFGLPEGHGNHNLLITKPAYDPREEDDIYNAKNFSSEYLNPHAWLVAQYNLNGDFTDASGNGHNGTATGVTATADRFGNAGQAMSFSAGSSGITIPTSTAFDFDPAQDFTFTAWVNGGGALFSRYEGVHDLDFLGYSVYISGTINMDIGSYGRGDWLVTSTSTVTSGWHFIVIEGYREEQRIDFSIDGSEFDGYIGDMTQLVASMKTTQPLIIAGSSSNGGFQGSLDDVRMYHGLLTTTDIYQLRAATK